MKKFLRILLIVVLLGLGFFAYKKYMPMTTTETTTGDVQSNSGLAFVHEDWFEKLSDSGSIEKEIKEAPGGSNEIAQCKSNPTNFAISCEEMQKELDSFILSDESFFYSGFGMQVKDLSAVTNEASIVQGLSELPILGKYPFVLMKKILTSTIWNNENTLDQVIEISGQQFANADFTRVFISFQGQDGVSPVLNIVFRKGTYVVSISKIIAGIGNTTYGPEVTKLIQGFYDAQTPTDAELKANKWPTERIVTYYTTMQANPIYKKIEDTLIAQANDRFAIK